MGAMGHAKPQAALTSGLLARKGKARPAMRSQGFGGFGDVAGAIEDLGWNDMGQTELPPVVLRERQALKEEIEAPQPDAPQPEALQPASQPMVSETALARIGETVRARQGKAKSAFTLRLDAERHLRLRLAAAVCNRSAQQLVTTALDAFLETMPEVETLAQSVTDDCLKFRGE